jgi:hypothetical protein
MSGDSPPMSTRRKKADRKERERKLDQAIEMTFPASDPIAVGRPTSTEPRPVNREASSGSQRGVGMRFTVGLKLKGKVHHLVVDAEDALIAALKVKCEQPDALVMYVRPQNRRGDARHPPLARFKPSGD